MYRQHAPYVYRLALKLTGGEESDAHDILQETWLKALDGLPRFRGESAFRSWLVSIAARTFSDHLRKRSPRPATHSTPSLIPDREASRHVERIDLERVLQELPSGFRAVLILHDVEGFKHREIAEIMGISAGTSKSQLSRARAWMRRALTPSPDWSPS